METVPLLLYFYAPSFRPFALPRLDTSALPASVL
jgi:hypothetical protein